MAGAGLPFDLLLQHCLHVRPLGINNAETNRVAFPAVGHNALVPDDSFLFRANAQNGRSRFVVKFIGSELHADGL
jgi:hypothetical protein